MQTRVAQGFTYTPFLQKRKMLWRIRALALGFCAASSFRSKARSRHAKHTEDVLLFESFAGWPSCEKATQARPRAHRRCCFLVVRITLEKCRLEQPRGSRTRLFCR